MPTLYILCGIPGSGKSTRSKSLQCSGVKCVVSDEYRKFITGFYGDSNHDEFVKGICFDVVEHYLRFGSDVCYDATNPTPESRKPWIDLGLKLGVPVNCIWVDTPLGICLMRNRKRENVVPDEVIERIQGLFIKPSIGEGFIDVTVLDGREEY